MQHRDELPPAPALTKPTLRSGGWAGELQQHPEQGAGGRTHRESRLQTNLDPGLDLTRRSFQGFLLLVRPDLVQP